MPVDLSRIGLEGIESAQRTLDSMAQRKILLDENTRKQTEFDIEQQERNLEAQAFSNLASGVIGDGVKTGDGMPIDADDPASMLIAAGTKLLGAGAPRRGQDLLKAGMDFMDKKSEINKRQYDVQKTRLDNIQTASQYMYDVFNDSANENELAFNMSQVPPEIQEILGADNFEQLKSMPYSDELRLFFRDKALSTKEQATLDNEQLRIDMQAQRDADNRLHQASIRNTNAENLRLREQELKLKGKAGGDKVPITPSGELINQAIDVIIGQVFNGKHPKEDSEDEAYLNNAAVEISGQALSMMRETPGLEYSEAVARAVASAQETGEFSPIMTREYRDFGLFETKGTTTQTGVRYKVKGRTKDNPLPLPSDPSKLVKGRYYIKNGQVKQY